MPTIRTSNSSVGRVLEARLELLYPSVDVETAAWLAGLDIDSADLYADLLHVTRQYQTAARSF